MLWAGCLAGSQTTRMTMALNSALRAYILCASFVFFLAGFYTRKLCVLLFYCFHGDALETCFAVEKKASIWKASGSMLDQLTSPRVLRHN